MAGHPTSPQRRHGVRQSRRRRGGGIQAPPWAWAHLDGCCTLEGELSWLTRAVPTAP
jgi:hypothetical protein